MGVAIVVVITTVMAVGGCSIMEVKTTTCRACEYTVVLAELESCMGLILQTRHT